MQDNPPFGGVQFWGQTLLELTAHTKQTEIVTPATAELHEISMLFICKPVITPACESKQPSLYSG